VVVEGVGTTVRVTVVEALRLPDVPVTLTVAGPAVARPATANVRNEVPAEGPGLKVPVTPVGRPETASVTAPENPYCGTVVTRAYPDAPCGTLSFAGEALSVNVGGGVTVSASVVFAEMLPDVPVTVMVVVPAVTGFAAISVSVPAPFARFAENVAVMPVGSPEAAMVTAPLKPFSGVTAIAVAALPPGPTEMLAGVAEMVKLGAAVMVSAIVVLLLRLPEVPVTVSVETPIFAVGAA